MPKGSTPRAISNVIVNELERDRTILHEQFQSPLNEKKIPDGVDAILSESTYVVASSRMAWADVLGRHTQSDFHERFASLVQATSRLIANNPKFASLMYQLRSLYKTAKVYVPLVMPSNIALNGYLLYMQVQDMAIEFLAQFAYYPNPKYKKFVNEAMSRVLSDKANKEPLRQFIKVLNNYGFRAFEAIANLHFDINDVRKAKIVSIVNDFVQLEGFDDIYNTSAAIREWQDSFEKSVVFA